MGLNTFGVIVLQLSCSSQLIIAVCEICYAVAEAINIFLYVIIISITTLQRTVQFHCVGYYFLRYGILFTVGYVITVQSIVQYYTILFCAVFYVVALYCMTFVYGGLFWYQDMTSMWLCRSEKIDTYQSETRRLLQEAKTTQREALERWREVRRIAKEEEAKVQEVRQHVEWVVNSSFGSHIYYSCYFLVFGLPIVLVGMVW